MSGPPLYSDSQLWRGLSAIGAARKSVLLIALGLGAILITFGDSAWPKDHWLHETLEWFGIGLLIVCVLGRTWSTFYIGGRKFLELVTSGPYSITRNPLHLFSVIGAVGVGAQLGSIGLMIVAGLGTFLLLYLIVLNEEALLTHIHGDRYLQYMAQVPRFIPNLALWRNEAQIEFRPGLVARTFFDACLFLLAIPLAESFEYLHDSGILPTLFRFP